MRILLVTVAGLSSRFSQSLGTPVIKCLYFRNDFRESLLYRMLSQHKFFDRIIIVGGYRFEELRDAIGDSFKEIQAKLTLVNNPEYEKYGSGYSFYKGMIEAQRYQFSELVFAEGDLFLDSLSFEQVCLSGNNIMTYNCNPIESDKSVAYYLSADGLPHYIYDTAHSLLSINEPFKAVYNSGQVWKFADRLAFDRYVGALGESDFFGTNLIPVNRYFQNVEPSSIEYVGFRKWINCNTVADFDKSLEEM